MAKLELKGFVLTVRQPETVGEKNTPKQQVIFRVPGYTDQFGDKVGQDEEWPLDIIGDNVAKLNLSTDSEGKKAKVTIYISGQKFIKKLDSTEGHMINARLHLIDFIEAKSPDKEKSW